MDTKYAADTKIANSRRQFEMQKANFDMEVNAKVRHICQIEGQPTPKFDREAII